MEERETSERSSKPVLRKSSLCAGDDFLGRALAQRTVDHAGLTEAAALGAAALDLDPGAIVNGLQIGDDRFGQDRRQSLDESLDDRNRRCVVGGEYLGRGAVRFVAPLVEAGDVDAGRPGEGAQQVEPRRALRFGFVQQLVDFEHHVLGLAEDEGVDEGGEGFGHERA